MQMPTTTSSTYNVIPFRRANVFFNPLVVVVCIATNDEQVDIVMVLEDGHVIWESLFLLLKIMWLVDLCFLLLKIMWLVVKNGTNFLEFPCQVGIFYSSSESH